MTSDAEDGASPEADFKEQDTEVGDDSMAESSMRDPAHKTESNASSDAPNGSNKAKSNDPSRPRRKKARRACFACQRAHLTCGMYSSFSSLTLDITVATVSVFTINFYVFTC
jgi:hypothetical protein